ncbi:hypothetical protein O3P69_014763 [Scylla paramamosain]|uniref:Uncharacterized protein n=1 Tax=Scylla paramamosain TaxID=85552 RepID=A0AAW0TXW2_SCYPA
MCFDYFSASPMGLAFTVITDMEGRKRVISIGDMALLAIWIKAIDALCTLTKGDSAVFGRLVNNLDLFHLGHTNSANVVPYYSKYFKSNEKENGLWGYIKRTSEVTAKDRGLDPLLSRTRMTWVREMAENCVRWHMGFSYKFNDSTRLDRVLGMLGGGVNTTSMMSRPFLETREDNEKAPAKISDIIHLVFKEMSLTNPQSIYRQGSVFDRVSSKALKRLVASEPSGLAVSETMKRRPLANPYIPTITLPTTFKLLSRIRESSLRKNVDAINEDSDDRHASHHLHRCRLAQEQEKKDRGRCFQSLERYNESDALLYSSILASGEPQCSSAADAAYALTYFNTDLEDGDEHRKSTLLPMLEYNTNAQSPWLFKDISV